MDNKTNRGNKQDAIRVDANDPSEVEYLHGQYPDKTHREVLEAVQQYGPMRENIEAHLNASKRP